MSFDVAAAGDLRSAFTRSWKPWTHEDLLHDLLGIDFIALSACKELMKLKFLLTIVLLKFSFHMHASLIVNNEPGLMTHVSKLNKTRRLWPGEILIDNYITYREQNTKGLWKLHWPTSPFWKELTTLWWTKGAIQGLQHSHVEKYYFRNRRAWPFSIWPRKLREIALIPTWGWLPSISPQVRLCSHIFSRGIQQSKGW